MAEQVVDWDAWNAAFADFMGQAFVFDAVRSRLGDADLRSLSGSCRGMRALVGPRRVTQLRGVPLSELGAMLASYPDVTYISVRGAGSPELDAGADGARLAEAVAALLRRRQLRELHLVGVMHFFDALFKAMAAAPGSLDGVKKLRVLCSEDEEDDDDARGAEAPNRRS
jgi:hypothetical protein